MYTGNQLRDMFLNFFASKGHRILPSASLIPKDDPTLLLTVAGMVPFKPYFMRKVEPPFPRATTSQKCVRTPDLEVVGKTARHHTFFEMLGNFSFGDYFKAEAIPWAWEFVTEVLKLPIDQLWITVHPEDEEAKNLWIEKTGVSPERIKYDPENLWAAGPVGPCGYCSEIYVDLGESRGCGKPDCALGCDCDRFLEIWNLVFMQYNRDESGLLTPLPKQNIDTGMGLERIASVMQGAASNFDTDLFLPIINKVSELSGIPYHDSPKNDVAMKVVADHTRAVSFMLSDGIRPGSEGRGYVLRRILRRAIRYARLLGIDKPFLEQIFLIIQRDYSHHYPELKENENFILNHLRLEEKNFQATLEQGTQILQDKVKTLQEAGETMLSGADAFYLYETYGFPVELTEEMLIEQGMSVDMETFNAAAEEHRRLAKEQSQQMKAVQESAAISEKAKALGTTPFLGYHELAAHTRVEALFRDGEEVKDAAEGDEVLIFLRESPFYAESGGQISDSGLIRSLRAEAKLIEVKKGVTGTVYHRFLLTQGVLHTGDEVEALVDEHLRLATARHHSATHLLQSALRAVLGEHVQQAGSLVTPDRLRFDFTHFSALTSAELQRVEDLLNKAVLANMPVAAEEMSLDAAKASGATALFGEKYGDTVRVVSMGDYSLELCGGTHIHATGDIGLVKIISESGIGAGLRRIEAVAGAEALKYMRSLNDQILDAAQLLKAQPSDLLKRIQGLLVQVKDLEKEVQQLNAKVAKSEVESLLQQVKDVEGVPVLAAKVSAQDMDTLRNTADLLKDKMKDGVLVLGAAVEGKVNWVTVVTPVGLRGLHAGQIIKEVAKITGGGGGGRPDMAQAGGKDAAKLGEALDQVPGIIKSHIK
ncbi:alanyl-tRNA synthetase [Desulfitobacterium hafniense DCB-2]|uniref:Alanine--tRNA ligase n=1 Tax=Desulfitobacterium hafniense (strain DSM 10664 / DCB-2) TaxID=272564 RepID=B8FQC2_DESHD|nr:alanine--tRNA ligase [Desulfitobacterium hafniense]ACL21583.1 alanyl-tRNA synthetase [Desulfitobacterium hafniense DCB-2]